MKVKKYVVKDMREAVRLIKRELGPDAVIITSRKVCRKGVLGFLFPRVLEVTAAVGQPQEQEDELEAAVGAETVKSVSSRPAANNMVQAYQQALQYPRESKSDDAEPQKTEQEALKSNPAPAELQMRRELEEMKSILHQMARKESVSIEKDDEPLSQWREVLTGIEVDPKIADQLLAYVNRELDPHQNDWNDRVKFTLINEVTRLLEPIYKGIPQGKILTFIGPTGVGKTTTLAKLAAQFTLFHQKSIAMLTIDTYRIGAVEQLRTYADIIGVPFEVVMTTQDLEDAVNRHSDKDLILIDTAGRPSSNTEKIQELKNFIKVLPSAADIFLVLSAATRQRDLYKIIEDYNQVEFNKLIVTKIDESEILGAFLNVAYRVKIPVMYVTDGQNVPDDIEQIYPKKLAKMLLRGVDGCHEGPSF